MLFLLCYLINRMPTQVLNYETSLTCFFKAYPHNPFISSLPLRVFSCTSFVHIHGNDRSKLDPKAQKCIFLWYSPTQKWYKYYSLEIRKYYTSMDVTLFENWQFLPKVSLRERELVKTKIFGIDVIAPISTLPHELEQS